MNPVVAGAGRILLPAHDLGGRRGCGQRGAGARVELLNGPIDREWECAPQASPTLTGTSGDHTSWLTAV
jgi:hypothetical protein